MRQSVRIVIVLLAGLLLPAVTATADADEKGAPVPVPAPRKAVPQETPKPVTAFAPAFVELEMTAQNKAHLFVFKAIQAVVCEVEGKLILEVALQAG